MTTRRRAVALLIETSNAYARGVLDGIIDYVRQHERWSIYLPEQERGGSPPSWLSRWKGDGIIARIENHDIAHAVRQSKLPVVDVSAGRHLKRIPWVETDDDRVAHQAAWHLMERGFQHLAFCGDPGFNWSLWRRDSFASIVTQAGKDFRCHDCFPRRDPSYSWDKDRRGLEKWLLGLSYPVGIMACYDIKAQQILDVCRSLDLAVPEQVAVVGVDNDRLLCDLADPPLSSVICNTHRTGYEAASLLDRMMAGEQVPAEGLLIPSLGVQTRQSTDISAIDDPEVASAIRYIRENACTGIDVGDVLKNVPMSRRVLESRFQKVLQRTPHQEIVRVRLERVKQLLVDTDLPLSAIARRAGFRHDEYLSVAFKKHEGVPPSIFRKQFKHQ